MKHGAAHLTLDSVAAETGLSKGGVLYNFPSKEALLQGMYERLEKRFEENTASLLKSRKAASPLEAHVLAGIESKSPHKNLAAAIIAAGANNPALLEPSKNWNKKVFGQLASGSNEDGQLVILLATYGLWFLEVLETSPLSPAQRKRVVQKLVKLARSTK